MEWKLNAGDLTKRTREFDLYSTVDVVDCRFIRQQDTLSFQASFCNYAVQPVCALRLSLVCRDSVGEILPFQGHASCECPIEPLYGQPKTTFMMPVPIPLWDNRAHSLEITVIQVRYATGQESVISRHRMIAPDTVPFTEEQKAVLHDLLACPAVLPAQAEEYWLCACGTPNIQEMNACRWCAQEKTALFEITQTQNLDRLAGQYQGDCEAQELLREQEEAEAVQKRKKMTRRVLIPCIAVFAAAVIIAGGFLACSYVFIPRQHYNTALEHMESGAYTSAAEEFFLAGRYRDAQEQYLEALFQNAVQVLETAESADDYKAAVALFEDLDGYGDSVSALHRARYSLALLLMEEKQADAYREAVAQLEQIIGYQDSETQLREAQYQLALRLLAGNSSEQSEALTLLEGLDGYKDSTEQIQEYRYQEALQQYNQADTAELYEEAGELFRDLGSYRDSDSYYIQSFYKQADIMMNREDYGSVLRLLAGMPSHGERQASKENAYYYQIVMSAQRYTVDEAVDILERIKGSYQDSKSVLSRLKTYQDYQGDYGPRSGYGFFTGIKFYCEGTKVFLYYNGNYYLMSGNSCTIKTDDEEFTLTFSGDTMSKRDRYDSESLDDVTTVYYKK